MMTMRMHLPEMITKKTYSLKRGHKGPVDILTESEDQSSRNDNRQDIHSSNDDHEYR